MKINIKYIEETVQIFFEIIVFMFAMYGFTSFMLLSSVMTKSSVIVISNDKEIKSFIEEKLKSQKPTKETYQLILNLTGKES